MCCCECRIDEHDIINVNNYTFFSQPRKQLYYRKSGGIGIFVKNELCKYVGIIDIDCYYIFWLKLKKCTFLHDNGVVIGAIYIPLESSRFFNLEELTLFDNEITLLQTNMIVYYQLVTQMVIPLTTTILL